MTKKIKARRADWAWRPPYALDNWHINPGVERKWAAKKSAKKARKEARRRKRGAEKAREKVLTRVLHPIYDSERWRTLRLDILAHAGGRCCLCGRGARHGVVLHVDHIKPISRYPALTWEPSNLQVLCEDCNLGKGNRYTDDWRG